MTSQMKLAKARDPMLFLRKWHIVKVPRGTTKVYLPRKKHYKPTGLTEEGNFSQLEKFYDLLEPCIVRKGAHGWGLHKCPDHNIQIVEE